MTRSALGVHSRLPLAKLGAIHSLEFIKDLVSSLIKNRVCERESSKEFERDHRGGYLEGKNRLVRGKPEPTQSRHLTLNARNTSSPETEEES